MTTAAAPRPPLSSARRAAAGLHLVLAATIVLAVFAQVSLIGAYVFGAGSGALDAHRSVGFTTHALEVLLLVVALVAWLPRAELLLSLALAVAGTIQIALASAHRWTGGLHPLGALIVLALATLVVRRDLALRRGREVGAEP